jgi:cell division protein FtsA
VLRQEFIIDGQEDVREPIGMSGVRLEVKVHIVTGAVSAAQNIVKCVRRCGLEVNDLILQPLASSRAVLSEDEKDLGVCLLDIGGGTTDIAIFTHGAIRHTAVIRSPATDHQRHRDGAAHAEPPMPRTSRSATASQLRQLADPNAMIDVPASATAARARCRARRSAEVIEPRVEELYSLVQQVLRESGFEELLSSGRVADRRLGGECRAWSSWARESSIAVRIGVPRYAGALAEVLRTPRYATAMGLLYEGVAQMEQGKLSRRAARSRAVAGAACGSGFSAISKQLKQRQGEKHVEIVDSQG